MNKLINFKFSLIIILFISLSVILVSSNLLANDNSINSQYEKLSQQVYNLNFELEQLKNNLADLKIEAEKLDDSAKSYYWQGQIYFLKAEVDEDNRVDYLEESKDLLEESIAEDDQFSDSYRALADVYMRLLDNKGRFFAIRNGPKVIDLLEEAMALDDENKAVYNSKGKAYLEAPRIGGGSADKALEFLTEALEIEPKNKQLEQFFNYYYLAEVYLELEDDEEALNYIEQALEVFSNNQEAKNLKEKITN